MPLFPGIRIHQSLILEDEQKDVFFWYTVTRGICSTTGYGRWPAFWSGICGDRWSWWAFWPPPAREDPTKKRRGSRGSWPGFADSNRQMMIAGHTHRPVFPQPGEGYYFNDGSCVHPRCITAIEIENHRIALVKWEIATRHDRSLFVDRRVLRGPVDLAAYFEA